MTYVRGFLRITWNSLLIKPSNSHIQDLIYTVNFGFQVVGSDTAWPAELPCQHHCSFMLQRINSPKHQQDIISVPHPGLRFWSRILSCWNCLPCHSTSVGHPESNRPLGLQVTKALPQLTAPPPWTGGDLNMMQVMWTCLLQWMSNEQFQNMLNLSREPSYISASSLFAVQTPQLTLLKK